MQYKNFTTTFLGIQEVIIKNTHDYGDILVVDIETKPKLHACPCCGLKTKKIHDYRFQKIQHSATFDGRVIFLNLKKRRYLCNHCDKRFYEDYNFLQFNFRKSVSLFNKIVKDLKSLKNFKTIAAENHVSAPTVVRYLNYEILLQGKQSVTTLPPHIGIDEFKGNCNNNKYQFHIFNLDTHETVDILEQRTYPFLEEYFSKITNRKEVEVISMDLYTPFKRIIKDKFINAKIVSDNFHFTRIAINPLDKLRIARWKLAKGAEKNYLNHSKRRLMMRYDDLSDRGKEKLLHIFEVSPIIKEAHQIKELFLDIKEAPNYEEKEKLFRKWLDIAESSTIDEFNSAVKTLRQWHAYISNSFKLGYSNGPTEGKNNLIKVIKRISFGFRNLNNFRNRILLINLK